MISKYHDFFSYLKSKNSDEAELRAMPPQKRKEIFLRWKWGGSEQSNNECESTRRMIMARTTREEVMQIPDEKEKQFWLSVLRFEELCTETLRRIGVLPSGAETDSEVNKLAQKFGGTASGGYKRSSWNNE